MDVELKATVQVFVGAQCLLLSGLWNFLAAASALIVGSTDFDPYVEESQFDWRHDSRDHYYRDYLRSDVSVPILVKVFVHSSHELRDNGIIKVHRRKQVQDSILKKVDSKNAHYDERHSLRVGREFDDV